MQKPPEPVPERSVADHKAPVWLLAGIGALIVVNLLDAIGTLDVVPQYQALAIAFSPVLKMAVAGAWAAVLAALIIDLLRRRRWAFRWAGPMLTAYALAGLAWQLLFARSDYGRGRLGFQALVAAVALIPVWWIVIRRRWLQRTDSDRLR
jgi:membrane associated rhomboid family serine protease